MYSFCLQVQELKSRLIEADKRTENPGGPEINTTNGALSNGINGSAPERQEEPPHLTDAQKAERKAVQTRNSDPSTGVIVSLCLFKKKKQKLLMLVGFVLLSINSISAYLRP